MTSGFLFLVFLVGWSLTLLFYHRSTLSNFRHQDRSFLSDLDDGSWKATASHRFAYISSYRKCTTETNNHRFTLPVTEDEDD